MRLVLEVLRGNLAGKKFNLQSPGSLTVGRAKTADVSIVDDTKMSSRHLQLECDRDSCFVRDLESTNGTYLNRDRIRYRQLTNGDILLAGQTFFRIRLEVSDQGRESPRSQQHIQTIPQIPSGTGRKMPREGHQSKKLTIKDSKLPFEQAFQDEDPGVRWEALQAAVWTRQTWLLDYCRSVAKAAKPEDLEALRLLGILGEPKDLDLILEIEQNSALGPGRFWVVSSYGHPATLTKILSALEVEDLATTIQASIAFTRLTGIDIESDKRVELPLNAASQPDDSEKESFEEAFLPDPAQAKTHWDQVATSLSKATRICRGHDISRGVSEEVLAQLDMHSLWEIRLRNKYHGHWNGRLADLERFPLD